MTFLHMEINSRGDTQLYPFNSRGANPSIPWGGRLRKSVALIFIRLKHLIDWLLNWLINLLIFSSIDWLILFSRSWRPWVLCPATNRFIIDWLINWILFSWSWRPWILCLATNRFILLLVYCNPTRLSLYVHQGIVQ